MGWDSRTAPGTTHHFEILSNISTTTQTSVVDGILDRSCLVSLDKAIAIGQYRQDMFINALSRQQIDPSQLEAAYPIMDGLKWQLVFTNVRLAQECAALNTLNDVLGPKTGKCSVTLYRENLIKCVYTGCHSMFPMMWLKV